MLVPASSLATFLNTGAEPLHTGHHLAQKYTRQWDFLLKVRTSFQSDVSIRVFVAGSFTGVCKRPLAGMGSYMKVEEFMVKFGGLMYCVF